MKLKSTLRKILVILLTAVMLFLIGITVYSKIGYRPFDYITEETVEKVTFQYDSTDEIVLDPNDVHTLIVTSNTNELRIAIPRFDYISKLPFYGCRLRFYMKNGDIHTIEPIGGYKSKLIRYGYIKIDGIQYYINYGQYIDYEKTLTAVKKKVYDKTFD